MNMAMICGLVNPFITNNNVTARGARSPGGSGARGAGVGRGGRTRGHRGACSRLEIHLQYRPRLFSCLITPCQLKLNNKIYAARSAPPTSLTSTPPFRAFGIRCHSPLLSGTAGRLWPTIGYLAIFSLRLRDFIGRDAIITERYTTRGMLAAVFRRKILSRCAEIFSLFILDMGEENYAVRDLESNLGIVAGEINRGSRKICYTGCLDLSV